MPTPPTIEQWPGRPFPLGAHHTGAGTNFAVFTEVADAVSLCLFDEHGAETVVEMTEVDGFVHHAYLPGVGPGQRYGFRVHGPWEPSRGARCNHHKLLVDPYARAIDGDVAWDAAVFDYSFDDPDARNDADSAPFVPKSVVTNPYFDWGNDRPPDVPLHETVIYETHVKGLTARHPDVPEHQRGTYAGLAHPSVIEYLKKLRVTAVELLPVHHFVHDHRLAAHGLRNYWGYNTIGFFAPYSGYSSTGHVGQQLQEFREMVRALHEAGLEVILDVVYNHTAESNHLGPVLSFKGLDNEAYYRLSPDDRRFYVDYTGTGNSLNMRHPHVLQLIMDSLRFWVTEMHVDGFRFDLAATLARELHDVDRLSAFFDLIQQDPIVSRVKLIAEPWDIGEGGYQVGNFPALWSEWNGKYRDGVRDYWRGAEHTIGEFASRLTGSSDLYEATGRRPMASINFITAHDGFTLRDLVSFHDKHNEENHEDNRDGESFNRSMNFGVEGPTTDPRINELRARQQRSYLATLLLSQGVPMLLGGDEIGRTQHGNNNAYCQDNEISWYDWDHCDDELLAFVRSLMRFRQQHPAFRRRRWFQGRPLRGRSAIDVGWYTPVGTAMSDDEWRQGFARSLTVFVNGLSIPTPGPRGERVIDDDFLLVFNAHDEPLQFAVPDEVGDGWRLVIDTASATPFSDNGDRPFVGASVSVDERAVVVLVREREH
ncbi:MAG TPA: glycogen debranching protein GlgX [Acidimicrobiia bacterium]|nr:glycogen debranching protein GlgX [Acidimicrobiia bacterium]